jgi:hypothetical protein
MEKQTHSFPTEEVTLPSKGLLYPKESPLSKGVIEIKYMTAREEDILTNQNYINNGTVIDKLLQSLIVTDCKFDNILIGDKNAILIAARILGYGAEYNFKYQGEEVSIDLTEIEDKELNKELISEGKNEFNFKLPFSKKEITFKLLSHGDEVKINNEIKGLKKLDKKGNHENTTRLKHTILSVDGDYEKKTIREFIDNSMLARDARALRKYVLKVSPDVNLELDIELPNGTLREGVSIPIGIGFFWPDSGI